MSSVASAEVMDGLSANDVAGQLDETFLDTYFTVAQGQWAI